METEKRLIEIPSDGVVSIPIMCGDAMVGEKRVDLSWYPTVDVVKVVRCKDCKHWWKSKLLCTHVKCCDVPAHKAVMTAEPDHFCSYGERKDNG